MRRILPSFAGLALLVGAACHEAMETPTTPTTTDTSTTRTAQFTGTLAAGASRFYSFTVSQPGTIVATLASVTSPPRGAAVDTPLGLGIGRPAGTGCALSASTTTGPALQAQLQETAAAGIYCVNVYDTGSLRAAVDFVVRFSYP
jgi:hypothetical protein